MLQGESHISRDPILLLGVSICPMSRFAERSHKSEKKTPRIVSLVRLWFKGHFSIVTALRWVQKPLRWTKKTVSFKMISGWCQLKGHATSYLLLNIFFTNSRVLVQMLWLSMQLEYVFEQLVRPFNRFCAVKSTAEILFELADSFSRSNWQLSNWQWIGRQLQLGLEIQ